MNSPSPTRRMIAAFAATTIALGTTAAIAQAKPNSSDDAEPSIGTQACEAIGCVNGNRTCGIATWSRWSWIPTPWVSVPWIFTESQICFERGPDA